MKSVTALLRWLPLLGSLSLAVAAACDPVPLTGRACPCADGFVCCAAENVCLSPDQICVGVGAWPPSLEPGTPEPMDQLTVFAASQLGLIDEDPQLFKLAPDMVIRAWSKWDRYGTTARDYGFNYVDDCHRANIRFMGGTITSVLFQDEFVPGDGRFDRFTTCDASGAKVEHENLVTGLYRATLANPEVRDYLIGIGKIQIDGGVDGLSFDEVNESYQGHDFLGNEGFDDYNLADFNAYLLSKFPAGTDFAALFDMPADNRLRRDLPAGDLVGNFNYRRYLASGGFIDDPMSPANKLAAHWGMSYPNRPAPGAPNFVDSAVPYRYWKQIVTALRDYAWQTYGRKIFITAKGIFPFVDFQTVGLYDYNNDGPGGAAYDFVPVTSVGHLRGGETLQGAFRHLRELSQVFAPGAPVVLFLDDRWPRYDALPDNERQDYWRLYAAEAYANGLFFAFRLSTATAQPLPPTAEAGGVLPLMVELAAFYRGHADLYHGVTDAPVAVTVTTSAPPGAAMIAVTDQAAPARRIVHIVNHRYDGGIVPQPDVDVLIPVTRVVQSVTLVSPDLPADSRNVSFVQTTDRVSVRIPELVAYTAIVLAYTP